MLMLYILYGLVRLLFNFVSDVIEEFFRVFTEFIKPFLHLLRKFLPTFFHRNRGVYVYLMAKYLISYLMIKAYRYEVIKSESIKNLYKVLYIRKIINYLIIFH